MPLVANGTVGGALGVWIAIGVAPVLPAALAGWRVGVLAQRAGHTIAASPS